MRHINPQPLLILMAMAISVAIFSSSCTSKIRNIQRVRTDSTRNIDTSTHSLHVKDTSAVLVDKSVTVITEKATGTVKTKADSAAISISTKTDGDSADVVQEVDAGAVKLKVRFHPKTGVVDVQAIKSVEDVTVAIDRTTTTHADINSKTHSTQVDADDKNHIIQTHVTTDKQSKVVTVKRFNFAGTLTIIGIFIVLIIAAYLYYWFRKGKTAKNIVDKIT